MILEGDRAILQFSGGKDSTALLYYMRPWLDKLTVVHCDTGAILPDIQKFILDTCDNLGVSLEIIRPPIDVFDYTELEGLPSDIVPFEATRQFERLMHGHVGQALQSYGECCANMIYRPFMQYIAENRINKVFRGSKRVDSRVGVADGYTENGVTYYSPLWDWTHRAVLEFLKSNEVVLPDHYKHFTDSLDCWICTGHLNHCGGERLKYIRDKHPDKWPTLQARLDKVERALSEHMRKFIRAREMSDG